ncbi:MAG: 30S ribosomal protein S16 [Myxococcota bacterium]|nr:30S ribosomal protein S16 [Myxococcota bacterium]
MAVRLRMIRRGRKKRPFYSVVAADSAKTRAGSYIEKLGTFDPLVEENGLNLNAERVKYWLSVGASPSDTVKGLIRKAGIEA